MATVEQRVSKIEGAVPYLATKEDVKDMATKADVEKAKSDLTWRIVIAQFAGLAAVAAIMGFLA